MRKLRGLFVVLRDCMKTGVEIQRGDDMTLSLGHAFNSNCRKKAIELNTSAAIHTTRRTITTSKVLSYAFHLTRFFSLSYFVRYQLSHIIPLSICRVFFLFVPYSVLDIYFFLFVGSWLCLNFCLLALNS